MSTDREKIAASAFSGPATDVFIAGGGPAGLACAIALARLGHTVRVADGVKPPIDKACGEGLMPDTLAALLDLGIDLRAASAEAASATICGIRFIDTAGGTAAQALFPGRSGAGRGIKRQTLHQLLVGRATELGVTFSWQTTVRGVTGEKGEHATIQTNRGDFQARYVVGADGHQSCIRSFGGLDCATTTARRIGLRQHFAVAPWTEFVEVYWSGQGQAYVTPVSATEVCVAFVARTKFTGGVPEALSHFPQLAAHLGGASPSDAPRGAITFSRKLRRVTRGKLALLGDASGSVDAVTGEGLSLAFRQALSLAEALHVNDLGSYERAHLRMRRLPHLMASTMLVLDRSPRLRTWSIALLAHLPRLFATLLAIHTGDAGLPSCDEQTALTVARVNPAYTPGGHNAVP